MADHSQLIDDALSALEQIAKLYRGERVAAVAKELYQQIRPTMSFDSDLEELRKEYEETPKKFTKEAAKARGPAYKTPVFKCLEDFEKCKRSTSDPILCRAVLAICVGKHLIPFVRHAD